MANDDRFSRLGDINGVEGFELCRDCGPELTGLVADLPPPESTVNGPFLPVDVVLGNLSILACLFALDGPAREFDEPAPTAAGGLGSNGRNLVVPDVLVEVVDLGEDLDEVVDLGDGPFTGGEGEEVDEGVMLEKGEGDCSCKGGV